MFNVRLQRPASASVALLLFMASSAAAQVSSPYELSPPIKVDVIRQSAALDLTIEFYDPNNNQALDAGETAQAVLTVINRGPGKAYRVNLRARPIQTLTGVKGEFDQDLGTLLPNQTVSERYQISADLNVPSGRIAYLIEAVDVYRRAVTTPKRLELEVRRFEPPGFAVIGVLIDDDQEGGSFGNNNRVVELDEKVECTVRLQNRGSGDARDAQASVGGPPDLLFAGRTFNLGDIEPGSYRDLKFTFSVPANYAGPKGLSFPLQLTENSNLYGRDTALVFTLGKSEQLQQQLTEPETFAVTARGKAAPVIADAPSLVPDVDVNIPQGRGKPGDAVALVIGIKKYESGVANAEFAGNDARVVREYFLTELGVPKDRILPHDPSDNITAGKFKRFVKDVLPQYVKPGQTDLFVYFSGHGAPDPNSGEAYLIPSDCDPNYLSAQSAYQVSEFYDDLSRMKPRQLVVVIEACYSGQSGGGDWLLKDISPGAVRLKVPQFTQDNGVLFNSSGAGQVSCWNPDQQHGLFTYFFLKGLQGAADADRDRQITVKEMSEYLNKNVPEESLRLKQFRQTPVVVGEPGMVLVKY
jgi:hypothetical protein